jgi:hypothetical protein
MRIVALTPCDRYDGVVTMIDLTNAEPALDALPEAPKQAAQAETADPPDRSVVTA